MKNLLLFFFIPVFAAASLAEEWHAFAMPWDRAPIDLTFLLDPPAGKHGFLGLKGNRFFFEDGEEFRIWGTTLTGGACFPPHDIAPRVAERLARFGINLVRFQHLDAPWAEPNLFLEGTFHTLELNRESLDRLDYFLYQLENRGIYAYLDTLDSRTLRAGDGVAVWKTLPPGMKGYIYYVPELKELHRRLLSSLWTHRNRYSQYEYRDSPSIVLTDLFDENDLFTPGALISSYVFELENQWGDWCDEKGIDPVPPLNRRKPSPSMQRFFAEVVENTQVDFAHFLRSGSVKIPIGGIHTVREPVDLTHLWGPDFIAVRGIWNEPLMRSKWYGNRKMTEVDIEREGHLFCELAYARLKNKPFVVCEWGEPWPNRYRSELPLWMAAVACFQDWQGCVSSTYRSTHDVEPDSLLIPAEAYNDPCFFGLFPAGALVFHRRDVKASRRKVVMGVDENQIFVEEPVTSQNARPTRLISNVKVEVDLNPRSFGSSVLSPTQPESVKERRFLPAKQAMLKHIYERGLVLIDSQRTQAAIGSINRMQEDDLSLVQVETEEPFGVVCVSSLDVEPISRSHDMLITLVSEARNTGFESRPVAEGFLIEKTGTAPVLIKNTPARLYIRSKHSEWEIHPLMGDGRKGEKIAYQIQDGILSFRGGIHGTLYYRLSCSNLTP